MREGTGLILFGGVAVAVALGSAFVFGALATIVVCAVALLVLIAVTRYGLPLFRGREIGEPVDAVARSRERMEARRSTNEP